MIRRLCVVRSEGDPRPIACSQFIHVKANPHEPPKGLQNTACALLCKERQSVWPNATFSRKRGALASVPTTFGTDCTINLHMKVTPQHAFHGECEVMTGSMAGEDNH